MDWLIKNMEWIFSGIGVFILTIIFTAFISRVERNKQVQSEGDPTVTQPTTSSSNLISEVIKELPKEVLKKWSVAIITLIVLVPITAVIGTKTMASLPGLGTNNHDVTVYAKLDSRVKPGETVELYPPSRRSVVSTDMEVEWELPFDQITRKTIELQKIGKNTTGGLTREVLVQLPIGEKPIVAFVLR